MENWVVKPKRLDKHWLDNALYLLVDKEKDVNATFNEDDLSEQK